MTSIKSKFKAGGDLPHYILLAFISVLIIVTAYALYDLNGHSLDPRDREVRQVVTGSMDAGPTDFDISTIPKDSLVTIVYLDPDDHGIEVGDVVAYSWKNLVVTHRVLSIDEDERTLTLKGDANRSTETVPFDDVIGKVVGVSAPLGKIVSLVKSGSTLFLGMVVCAVLIVCSLSEICRIVTRDNLESD
ncbi:hypothetical protein [Methanomethylophilus alvi]|uniref:hypothetical protein n=2 Tax=Methanomethylophilus alvi TaxID=1291540 RepID=UPI0037DDA6A1